MSLGQLHAACDEQFRTLCESSDSSSELQAELLEEATRYGLWAGTVGAGHPGQWSLDYRLREASLYRNEVSRILQILQSQLQNMHDLANGEQLSHQPLRQEPDIDCHTESEHSGSESSWGLSDTDSIDNQQKKIEDESNSVGPDDVQKLLQSIRLAISILYKLPLRRPAPMDRLRYGTIGEGSWSEGPDVAYVKDKFPNSRLPENVMIRLGKAITKRRQLLSYRRSHREKLKNAAGWADDASQPGSQAMTKATTLHSDQMIPLQEVYEPADSVADSAKTSIAASQATQEISLEVPPRPLDKGGQSATTFQCNYCQLTVHFASDSSWRRHVLGDLQPFKKTGLIMKSRSIGSNISATQRVTRNMERQPVSKSISSSIIL
ncbi:hypothetical protein CGGC5_v009486 [Colletotrichum fructicola Nara gc5]|uniref:Oxidoreductase acuF-like C2H2 type zinc-finger domain-containing protein n=1 Tax=Colletotrichum fructicola (strain Nara gc5) TaxID=1213859 RepID=A0A7J6IYD0_COLFN|nr:hypothetical protein CGGC5_v009486 [Colletotrichum fructicola Nara gc5]KAF4899410.1 hypothetical protein CGCFRS4_v003799 [Colletotrichum fructicola]